MKTTKRILSICLSFVLLISVIATGVVSATSDIPAFDETKPYIKATSTPVMAGEIAKVTFTIGNNPKFWGVNQSYKFDSNVLSFVEGETNSYGTFPKYDKGTAFSNSLISPINNNGEFTFIFTEIYNDTEIKSNSSNGELFSIYLKVADDATPGTYNIDMVDYKAENYLSLAGKPVAFTFNQPAVVVYDPDSPTTTTVKNNPSSDDILSTTESSSNTTKPSQSEVPSQKTTAPTQNTTKSTENTTITTVTVAPTTQTTATTTTQKSDKKPTKPVACVHTTTVKNAKKATYFAKGYTGDTVCIKCNVTIKKGKTVAKLKLATPKFKVKAVGKKLKVTYKKVNGANRFQVRFRIKGKWKVKTFKAKKNVTKFIKKLKKGTYKVQVRAMVKQGKNKAFSKWAKQKKVKIK